MVYPGFTNVDTLEHTEIRELRKIIAQKEYMIQNLKNKIAELEMMIKTRVNRKIVKTDETTE